MGMRFFVVPLIVFTFAVACGEDTTSVTGSGGSDQQDESYAQMCNSSCVDPGPADCGELAEECVDECLLVLEDMEGRCTECIADGFAVRSECNSDGDGNTECFCELEIGTSEDCEGSCE